MRRRNDYFVTVFDNENDKGYEKIRYCPYCEKAGYRSILGPRIYFKINENGKKVATEPESDHENWLMCHRCGDIVKIGETKIEGEVSDVVESEDDSSTDGEVQVLFSRNSKNRKGRLQQAQERNTRDRINDPEAIKAIR